VPRRGPIVRILAQWRGDDRGSPPPSATSLVPLDDQRRRGKRGQTPFLRKTDGKRSRKKLVQLNERLRSLRSQGGAAMLAYLVRHLRGHIQYYGVSGNF
jgi:hypothetical protein